MGISRRSWSSRQRFLSSSRTPSPHPHNSSRCSSSNSNSNISNNSSFSTNNNSSSSWLLIGQTACRTAPMPRLSNPATASCVARTESDLCCAGWWRRSVSSIQTVPVIWRKAKGAVVSLRPTCHPSPSSGCLHWILGSIAHTCWAVSKLARGKPLVYFSPPVSR